MSRKQAVAMKQIHVEWDTWNKIATRGKFEDLYWHVHDTFIAARARHDDRADECWIRTNVVSTNNTALMIIYLTDTMLAKLLPFIRKAGGKNTVTFDYHRVPFGKINDALVADGYKCIRKFTAEDGDKLHMYAAPGRPTIFVTLPTFIPLRAVPLDLGIPRAGESNAQQK